MGAPRRAAWRRAGVVGALLLVAPIALAACGGDQKPTRDQVREKRINEPVRRESVNASVGPVRLLTVRIETPVGEHEAGSNSALFLSLANSGPDDRLVAVSSVDARSVVQRTGAEPPASGIDIPVTTGATVSMQSPDGLHLELVELERDLGKRTFVPVSFRFAKAGPVTVKVFVSGVDHPVVAPLPTADSTG
jgi:periplasmic copper chaperone A